MARRRKARRRFPPPPPPQVPGLAVHEGDEADQGVLLGVAEGHRRRGGDDGGGAGEADDGDLLRRAHHARLRRCRQLSQMKDRERLDEIIAALFFIIIIIFFLCRYEFNQWPFDLDLGHEGFCSYHYECLILN